FDEKHKFDISIVEDEYYVCVKHEMTKSHYISFIAAVSSDRIELKKLYPGSSADARFKISGVSKIFFYCNKDGLYYSCPKRF
ncbi:MAG: XRE family transcriptional regulator, partial [Lachnospiraceae bacterium]|nr:XRE family transcriptional regulator [Lachnospiraceae bacterium]